MALGLVGKLTVMFGADFQGFDKAMKKAQKSISRFGAKMERTGQTLTRNVTLPLAGLGIAAVKMASDFEETDSKFKTVFSSIQKQAENTAHTFKNSFGLSSKAAKQMLGDTGDLLVGFGFTEKEALNLSKQVNELAVDLASFTNFSGGAEGASLALTKALLGERESIKSLGIAITEADLKSFAKDQGLIFKELTRVEKATLTYQLAAKQSSKAIGDFARTSGSFANQTRILVNQITDLGIELGQQLLPIAQKLLAWSRNMINRFSELTPAQKQNALEWGAIAFALGPVLTAFGTLIRLMQRSLIPFLLSTTGLVAALASAFILLFNNLGHVSTRIANEFANKDFAGLFVALGAALKSVNLGGDVFIELGAKMATVVATGKNLPEKEFKSFSQIIKELSNNFKELTGVGSLFGGMGGMNFDNGKIPFLSAMNPAKLIGPLNNVGTGVKKLTENQIALNEATKTFENVFSSAMTSAAYSQEGFFNSFLENLKQAIKQMLIQLAITTAIKFMFGGGKLTLKDALGQGLKDVLNLSKIPKLSSGGIVTGPTMALIGEGNESEAVLPLSKLNSMMNNNGGGVQKVEVFGRISGNDIFLANQRGSITRFRSV
jgi:hypothetical protein